MLFWHVGVTAMVILITLGRRRIDYRVVLLGAILPDLIDKPIGRILFEERFETSRLYGHTLAFAVLLLLIAALSSGEFKTRWFVLPVAVVIHLGLDSMWNDPITLFWPAFGTRFPPDPVRNYWLAVLIRPLEHPLEAVKELVGLACALYIAIGYRLNERGPRRDFLRTGLLKSERELEKSA